MQIILRWHIQEDNIVIPGARKEEHIKANIDINPSIKKCHTFSEA